jgi:hypothetical protein
MLRSVNPLLRRALPVFALALSSACAPRLYLRHETPPALDAAGVTVVTVQGATPQAGPNLLQTLMDPMGGLAAAVLEPEVVAMTQRELSRTCALAQGSPAEGTLYVQLTAVRATGGTAPAPGQTNGAALTVKAEATFTLVRSDGQRVFSENYFGRQTGPTPTVSKNGGNNFAESLISVQNSARLAQQAMSSMVQSFVADLVPGETTDTLLLADPEPLKPAVKAALDGDLEGAMQQHQAYAATNPNDGRVWANIGALHSVRGQLQEAIVAYERAAQLGGDERFLREAQYARNRAAQMQYLQGLKRAACGPGMR